MIYSVKQAYRAYYHHFPHWMLTKPESLVLHLCVLLFASLIGYTVLVYLPANIMFSISRAYYYLFGNDYGNIRAETSSNY